MPLPNDLVFRVKAAMRDLIERCGGLARAGQIAGYSTSSLQRFGAAGHADMPPIAAILLLERDCGETIVTRLLFEVQQDLTPAEPPSFARAQAWFSRAVAEFHAVVAEAHADEVITPREQADIERQANAVAEQLAVFRAANARVSGAKPGRKS